MRAAEKPEIAALPLFAAMDPEQRDRIFGNAFLQVFPPALKLFETGQRADFLHILVDGLVELYTSNGDRTTTMAILRPVRSFILAAAYTDQPYLMSARTLSASRILMIPSGLIRDAIDNDRALMQGAMTELSYGFRYFVRALTDMKLRQSVERLGNYLLIESDERGGAFQFDIPIEKRTLASLLGMTPENLSRAFSALAAHGVNVDGSVVQIVDRDRLAAFAKPDAFPTNDLAET
ncbi:helix-turn-helix domain-containing protein [Sphingorhabdus sp.]|uniref:helix-turn-helix domain-containing protein n=1 Tax=Sphingorhabdus sp. TaxID=1902408 RepID=UPI0035AEEA34